MSYLSISPYNCLKKKLFWRKYQNKTNKHRKYKKQPKTEQNLDIEYSQKVGASDNEVKKEETNKTFDILKTL